MFSTTDQKTLPHKSLNRDRDFLSTPTHENSVASFKLSDVDNPATILDYFRAADIPENIARRAINRSKKWRSPLRKSISLENFGDDALRCWNLAKDLNVPYCTKLVTTEKTEHGQRSRLEETRSLFSARQWNAFTDQRDPDRFVIAPEPEDWDRLKQVIKHRPELRSHISITTPDNMRRARSRLHKPSLVGSALGHLEAILPGQSATRVVSSLQGAFALLAIVGVLCCFVLFPGGTSFVTALFFAIFFSGCVSLRVIACLHFQKRVAAEPPPLANGDLPNYTVLVPLYKEAGIAPQLIANLQCTDYPPDLLDIKIILEEDDADTIAAVYKHLPGAPFEVILVPNSAPRTKPKALNYALNFAEGDLVCIFDAEDCPDPDQLRRAAAVLMHNDDVGAVQCSLSIKNGDESWISRLFAIEYEALFKGLLPTLDRLQMPMPLGGTSNHFRRSILEATGAWDAYNVTEDADLGIRLARHGYRSTTLPVVTLEEAPINFSQWLPQRTRWFKGWIQSWLVHMRNPVKLYQDLGFWKFCVAQIIMGGMFLSSALHPIFAVLVLSDLLGLFDAAKNVGVLERILHALNLFNFIAGYLASMLLATVTLIAARKTRWLPSVLHLPIYWWLMSLAAWRALFQLFHDPFKWEKTDHGVSKIKT